MASVNNACHLAEAIMRSSDSESPLIMAQTLIMEVQIAEISIIKCQSYDLVLMVIPSDLSIPSSLSFPHLKSACQSWMAFKQQELFDPSKKLMIANALSESVDECSASGMDSFVSKPVTFQK
ncbi:hypothetical protein DITRI_Ditri03aG0007200 [Diplodiscus trichospermus]